MKYLLDTNVISELVAKQPNAQVVAWIDSLDAESVYLSVITIGELRKGIEKLPDSQRKTKLREWLDQELLLRFENRILVIDVPVMLKWGELVGRLERTGKSRPAMDSLIAAIALYHNCVVVTRNAADFADTGASIANPWE